MSLEEEKHLYRGESDENTPINMRGDDWKVSSRSGKGSCCGCVVCVALFLLAVLLLVGATFTGGLLVGKYSLAKSYDWGDQASVGGKTVDVLQFFDDNVKPDNIMANLRNLTRKPHIAGSDENKHLAETIYDQWLGFSFDTVELVNYSVLLSYPNQSNPNTLTLLDNSSNILYDAKTHQEPPLTPGENDSTVAAPFNAYSGSGDVEGSLVYVNYARIEDFLYITGNLSLNITGKICIARYGGIFRGDKAHLSQRFGCVGLLIYSDPEDYAPSGVPVYPAGPSLPPGGVQRGSLMIITGDPLTPGIPAIDGVYRRPYNEVQAEEVVPSIPVQPISYGDAIHFISQLSEHDAPDSWVGGLNTKYHITQSEANTNVTHLVVNNYQERRSIYNVIATIYGSVEPDRQVVLGNHRDAWVFGAVDPNSGTAGLMELARVAGELRKNNWRPGRTVVLCSWDAEEYGLVGSTEWVEDKGKLLGDNTVAYLNVDVGVSGQRFFVTQATPLMYNISWEAAKMVKCPNADFDTVYDEWLHFTPKDYDGQQKPLVLNLGSGSDFTGFLQSHGISCTSQSYTNQTSYAVYHSVHDNFFWMTNFADPDFSHHRATALVWVKMAVLLSTRPLLPYDPRDYAVKLGEIFSSFKELYADVLQQQDISIDYLGEAVSEFQSACAVLWAEMAEARDGGTADQNLVRYINNKLMNVERAFVHDEGLPGRPYFKHVIFAPSSVNSYAGAVFPGVSDTIFAAQHQQQGGGGEGEGGWDAVRREMDIVRNHLRQASMIMNLPGLKYLQKM